MSTSNCYRGSNKNNSSSRTNKNTPESFDSEVIANQKGLPNIPQYPSNNVTNDQSHQRSTSIHPATVTSATARSSNISNTINSNNSISISNRNHSLILNYQEENRYTTNPYPSTSSNTGMHSNRKYPIPDPAFRPPSSSLYYSYNHPDPRNYPAAMTSTSSYSDPRSYWYQQYHQQQPQHQTQHQEPYHQHQLHHHNHHSNYQQQQQQQHHTHHQQYQQQHQLQQQSQLQQQQQLQQQSQLQQQQQQTQHHHLTPSGSIQPYHGNNHHDHVVDMLHLSNSGREARNRAEKNRRDKLNGSIQELSSMVPHVAESPRRVDKTAVLRFSAHGLRLHYVFGKTLKKSSQQNTKPQLTDSLMKLMDSFLITITCHGQIVLISPSVEQHLGHCQTDLFGQNILHITHPDDHAMLKQQLIPTDLENLLDIQPEDEDGEPRTRSQSEEDEIDRKLRTDKRNFTVRLARAGPRSEPTCYEIVKIDGCFRRSDSSPRGAKTSTFPSGLQLIRRARGRDDTIPLHSISGNDIVLVAMARIIRPPKLSSRLLEANYFEYKTRHLIDGRIVDCDQRISLVAGYMTDEVTGLSPFTFIHQDDVRWVIVALRQMYDSSSPYGESCYRLLTRNGRFIYLRTKGYLEIDKATNKVHSFVCINSLCNEIDGKVRCDEMKNKFSIIIDAKVPSSTDDVPASENPQQLEKAVMCLIQNLQNNAADEDTDDTASSSQTSPRSVFETRHRTRMSSQSKTPPLALIVPETSTVKSSISKSVSAVNVTVVKSLRNHSTTSCSSPSSRSHDADISNDSTNSELTTTSQSHQDHQVQQQKQQETQQQQQLQREQQQQQQQIRPSVLQKNGNLIDGSMPQSISLLRSSPEIVEIKQEYMEQVPSLSNNDCNCDCDCDCYFDNDLAHNDNCILYNPSSNLLNEMLEPIGHTSVLKRRHDYLSDSSDSIDDNQTNHNAKRRIVYFESFTASQQITDPTTDLHNALTSTFDELGRSLNEIENVTSELREQCNTYIVPNSQLQLEEIIEEQQEQRDMLVNIKSEYEAQLQQNGTGNVMTDNDIDKMSIENSVDIKLTHKNDLMPR